MVKIFIFLALFSASSVLAQPARVLVCAPGSLNVAKATDSPFQKFYHDSIDNKSKIGKILSFTFNRFYFKDTIKVVECLLQNNTDSTFWILGYDTVSSQGRIYIHPIYSMKIKNDGKWKDSDLGFSGIGIERFSLKPGEKLFFETSDFPSAAEAITFGLDMRIKAVDNKLRILREIRTDEIKVRPD